jgi:predicted negative regulator of RcsB-dependent stress response
MDHVVPPVVNVAHKARFESIASSGPFNIVTIVGVIVIAAVGFWLWRKWQQKTQKKSVSFAKPVARVRRVREPEPEPEEEEVEEVEEESDDEEEEEDSKDK